MYDPARRFEIRDNKIVKKYDQVVNQTPKKKIKIPKQPSGDDYDYVIDVINDDDVTKGKKKEVVKEYMRNIIKDCTKDDHM